ncbi:MAG: PLDc N-terminal domain-containing protein [Methanosarcinaceae archaeon]|nr:PLDc N-terminal domain-containing protein [Methanosarcinaceae archaeon]
MRVNPVLIRVWILAALIFGIIGAIAYYFLGKKK